MTDDDKFVRELRATLDGLASEPAPNRLVAEVREIPSREPRRRRLGIHVGVTTRGSGSGFSLLAAGVAVLLLAILARPGASPSPAAGPASFAPAVPTGVPLETPSAPASSSVAVVATPAPRPAGRAVPGGFEPMSATFVSADLGWVLGSVPCDGATCPAIVRTEDGGATWSPIGAPKTTIGSRASSLPAGSGVTSVRFADALDGWAFGPELWATHTGGADWERIVIPGMSSTAIVAALETSAGDVHAVLYDGAQAFRMATSPIGADAWRVGPVSVPVGAGPVPHVQLALAGASGWVLEDDRVTTAGARLDAGTWRSWQPPCLDLVGPAVLGASDPNGLVAACNIGLWSTPKGEHLFASTDGGTTFAETGTRMPLDSVAAVATPDRSTIVVAGSDSSGGAALLASFDGGRTWSRELSAETVSFSDLGFTTPTQGIVVTTSASGTGRLLMTHDAGLTWAPVDF
jgi:hypothetical protein